MNKKNEKWRDMFRRCFQFILAGFGLLLSLNFKDTHLDDKKPEFLSGRLGARNNELFCIQRSINASLIIYELNGNKNGEPDDLKPINIYWQNLATDSSTQPLNYIQNKYAYGLDVKVMDVGKKTYYFNFVSYKRKTFFLSRSGNDGRYRAFCEISGKNAVLNKIFIQIDGGSFWLPKIKFIEISGTTLNSQQRVAEKIVP